ncbi:MAG: hypothetical protein MJ137_02385 [Clostridia bacterium]|nr:hypothetical protein [Clostridia bacterium]
MCNIAGYVGEKDAAPVLIDLIKKEEGFAGGYYTGIATIHEGKLYYAKLTGDCDRLVALTNAAKLPGKIGIMHSRSKSGGGDAWAHPFIGEGGKTAYIANGCNGFFNDTAAEKRSLTAERLSEAGYRMTSACRGAIGAYPMLKNGDCVHISEVMCQLITEYVNGGSELSMAMESACLELPSEIVALALSLEQPDVIGWARINFPGVIGFASHGAYIASTPAAFPADVTRTEVLPVLSRGVIGKSGFTAVPMENFPAVCAAETDEITERAYAAVKDILTVEPVRPTVLKKKIRTLFGEGDIFPSNSVMYRTVARLVSEGYAKIESRTVEGAFAPLTAPEFVISRIEKMR